MEQLLSYLFRKHITDASSPLIDQLCKQQGVSMVELKPNQEQLNLLQFLIAKNIVRYSPTHLQASLNVHMVLFYQRIYKLKEFAQQYQHPVFKELLNRFIEGQMVPVPLEKKEVQALQGKEKEEKKEVKKVEKKQNKAEKQKQEKQEKGKKGGKGKGRKKKTQPEPEPQPQPEPQVIVQDESSPQQVVPNNNRLFYEYSSQGQTDYMVNLEELTTQLKWLCVQKYLGKDRAQDVRKQLGMDKKDDKLFMELHLAARQKSPRAQIAKNVLLKTRQQKVEEFILQLFRKYDHQGDICSPNCLLLFNLIRKYPLTTEKQLQGQSLLQLVVLRKCVSLLIQEGLVNYYPQTSRTYVYRIRQYNQIEQLLISRLAKAIFNLHIHLQQAHPAKDQKLKVECMLWDLDDTLMLFTA